MLFLLTNSVVWFACSQLQSVTESSGVNVICKHGGCIRCSILRGNTSNKCQYQRRLTDLCKWWYRRSTSLPLFIITFFLYLDFVHTVSGVQATNTLQSPSNIQSCGISSQVQTLLLFSVRQHTPGDCEPQLTLVHGWIQGCISKYINKYQTSHLLFFDLGYCWRTGAEEEGVKRPKSWSLDAPCWLWKILFSTK